LYAPNGTDGTELTYVNWILILCMPKAESVCTDIFGVLSGHTAWEMNVVRCQLV